MLKAVRGALDLPDQGERRRKQPSGLADLLMKLRHTVDIFFGGGLLDVRFDLRDAGFFKDLDVLQPDCITRVAFGNGPQQG